MTYLAILIRAALGVVFDGASVVSHAIDVGGGFSSVIDPMAASPAPGSRDR